MSVLGGLTNSCEKKRSEKQKERYKHLNAEFQRIARIDKKAFLSHQCKEIVENNRMGKTRDHFNFSICAAKASTRDHFKKIRDTKGKFYAKIGTIKNRNYTHTPNRSRRYNF